MTCFVAPDVTPASQNEPKLPEISVNQSDEQQPLSSVKPDKSGMWRLSVAPMLDWMDFLEKRLTDQSVGWAEGA